MSYMGDQHNSVAGCNSEQCDKADHGRDGQDTPRDEYSYGSPNQCQWQIGHDDERVTQGIESGEQDHKNADYHQDSEPQQALGRTRFALKLAAVFDAVAVGKLNRGLHTALDVIDNAPQVPSCNVALDHNLSLHVFAVDEVGASVLANIRHGSQGNSQTSGGVDLRLSNGFYVCQILILISNNQRKGKLSL